MARPRILPDADELHRLRVVEGKTYDEIAAQFGVTKAAVHLALRKSGLVTPRPRYDTEIPWTVALAHKDDYLLAQLRYAARLKRGEKIPEQKARYVRNWIDEMSKPREGAPNGLVVHYDRTIGFTTVPRGERDQWLICEPQMIDVR